MTQPKMQKNSTVEMQVDGVTTRQQLQGYGASRYLARTITGSLTPVGKEGRAWTYSSKEVIGSIRNRLQNSRIKLTTQETLNRILNSLLERLGNVVQVSFGSGTDPELSELTKQLFKAMSKTDKALGELKATAANLKKRK
jgi:hypothetical protein